YEAPGEPDREPRLAGGGGTGNDEQRRRDGHSPVRTPRSAYGPACSIRAATSRPTSSGPPSRWTSLFWRLRPDTRGPAAAPPPPSSWSSSWSWLRGGVPAATTASTSGPTP